MPIIDITPPAEEPIKSDDVKSSARLDGTAFDSQIGIIIPALRRNVEGRLGRRLVEQTVELVLEGFPTDVVDLVLPDVSEIVSVKYLAPSGEEQLLAEDAYQLHTYTYTSSLLPAGGAPWPVTADKPDAVRIRFKVGFGAAESVPQDIKLWMVAHAVQIINSPDGLADAALKPLPFVDALLDRYRIYRTL